MSDRKSGALVLIVDDSPSVVSLLTEIIRNMGYSSLFANDGRQALEILEKTPVSLILSDVDMPQMGGVEFYQHVRARGLTTPFVFITGSGEDLYSVRDLDCVVYVKPVEKKKLERIVECVLKADAA